MGLDPWAETLLDSPGKGPGYVSSSVLNLDSYLPFRCAPLGLCKWDFCGLMASVMNLAGCCLGFSCCHCLSKFLWGCSDKFLSHNLIPNIIHSLLLPAKSNEFVFFELSQPLTKWEEDRLTELITGVSKRNRAPDLAEFLSLKQALPLFKDLSPEESSFMSCHKDLLKQYMPKENTSDAHESVIQVSG